MLAEAGLHANEAAPKARLAVAATEALGRLTAGGPSAACWVPGRLELFGTHTDYAGGRTLVAALPRGFVFIGAPRSDGRVAVIDAISGDRITLAAVDRDAQPDGWRRYVATVVQRLARNFPDVPLGADISFASDLPPAAGMSSSSALMVGLAVTLIRLSGIRDCIPWRENISGALDEAGYYACIENGRDFRALAGDAGVGTHGGSEDHAAMICSLSGTLTALSFVPMRCLDTVSLPDTWGCVVASSGVAAEKTGGALTAYNRLSEGATVLLALWNTRATEAPSLAAVLARGPDAARQLEKQIDGADVPGWTRISLRRRLQHFMQEDARIPQGVDALRRGDAQRIGDLSAESQSDSERLLENQVPETITLARLALQHGAFASRSFGAGFGGSVWALVDRSTEDEFARAWTAAYRTRHPLRAATAFTARPGPGVLELLAQR